MTSFARLFATLDQTMSTNAKVAAMVAYFGSAPPGDAAWATFFLTGRRVKRLISARTLGQWLAAVTGLHDWLLEECQSLVGDAAETLTLLVDCHGVSHDGVNDGVSVDRSSKDGEDVGGSGVRVTLAQWVEERLLPLRAKSPAEQQARVLAWLREVPHWERFTLLKILTGELRIGVSHSLVVRALAQTAGVPEATIATRLAGEWTPGADWFTALLSAEGMDVDPSRPYPFCLAAPMTDDGVVSDVAALLGDPAEWIFEWKWDGIRAQVIVRGGRVWIWSRGSELITDRFPEIAEAASALPAGTVLDGELLAFTDDEPQPFALLQARIGRQRGVERRRRDIPVVFIAFDVIEHDGVDVRNQPLATRRQWLERLIEDVATSGRRAADDGPVTGRRASDVGRAQRTRPQELLLPFEPVEDATDSHVAGPLRLSAQLDLAGGWDSLARQRQEARAHRVEGVMLKRRASPYGTGRKRGDWWKWKIEPHSVDAVLVYAQPGSGQRASLLTDYTFAVWDGDTLVPFAKAYSGLTDAEIAELDRWLRRHTVERFGPVRHVEPLQVFEIGFEAIAASSRHRSGIAVRFPRMLRWRRDKNARDADTLEVLRSMVPRLLPAQGRRTHG